MREPKDIVINGKTLAEILENHQYWWCKDREGWQCMKADLRGANLGDADLRGADLRGADLGDVKYNEKTAFFALQCPEEGSYIGWKKAREYIVKLRITDDAKRSSATTRKCRASKAEVLEIQNIDGTKAPTVIVRSSYDEDFIYEVGKIVEVKNFDTYRWNECSTGIHHFITRQEAVSY